MRADEITRAVLARDDIAKYLAGTAGEPADRNEGREARREQVGRYLDELATTQRYRFYRALQHPLYPILRKVRRIPEHVEHARDALSRGRALYVSNHKSHLDYLIEPLVLDDHDLRPPVIAAGINLFGGPLGLLHRHVTGALPIRRNSKDPLYLVTLRAYVAELLNRRDLLYYAEGGRSYSGELKSPKTGLLQAALQADRRRLSIVPVAIAYDLVLEDRIIAHAAARGAGRKPFAQEVAEMARYAVGYRSRAFVTFGQPIPLADYSPDARRDLVRLAQRIRGDIGRLYKVLPTALVAASIRPRTTLTDLRARVHDLVARLTAGRANLAVRTGRQAVDEGLRMLADRNILMIDENRIRVRDRIVLRYYARTIEHLIEG